MSKSLSKPTSEIQEKSTYKNLLHELKSILSQGQAKAYKAVDNIKVQTYWQIGERIVREELQNKDRADYGDLLIINLVEDLIISRPELYKITKFFRLYENVLTVSRQLSWNHYTELLKLDDQTQRTFYQEKVILHSWSVRELRKQIKANLFKNTSPKEIEKLPYKTLPSVNKSEVFKSTYDLGFTGWKKDEMEIDLENKIVKNIDTFLKELGNDFGYHGRQVPIKISNSTHYIDIALYHKGIPCNVLVELKTGKFDEDYVGQMNKYIEYYRQHKQYEHDKDTIGLIICQEADHRELRYVLGGLDKKIFVATYKAKLPSENTFKKAVKKIGGSK